ncbi:hypothetical protein CEV32_3380 [Brucella rhizosphaerae]|uniref:Uncharacterized protein n=1 Tax=Brucella rhizosphaerae TaxID=571254 RepID=A0A256FU79_9HYPH|nr:hypothetical protein CEV32_3380 [Brucella rhizosphaerae]
MDNGKAKLELVQLCFARLIIVGKNLEHVSQKWGWNSN